MYILKNAWMNLGRNKGRNFLLSVIIFILILSTTIGMVINTTTKGIIEDYKNRFGSKVTLSVDFDKLMIEANSNENGTVAFPSAPEISPEKYVAFAESVYLKKYQMNMTVGIVFEKLKAVDEKTNDGMMGNIGGGNEVYVSPTAKLLGYNDANDMPGFSQGQRKIIEGALHKEKNECIVSSDFANLNELKVQDTFLITDTESKKIVTLKVVGIYADATKAKAELPSGSFSMEGSFGNRRNEIFVTMDTMRENFDISTLVVDASYELKSPDLVKDFEKELREKGLPTAYNVETDEVNYNRIVEPVIGLSNVAFTFMSVILCVGSVILLFITTMAIRERKYEIGVLRAMGLKKAKVALMLVTETIMITFVCLIMGLVIGSFTSQTVADTLIANQVETIHNSSQGNMQFSDSVNFAGSIDVGAASTDNKPLSEIDVSLSTNATIQIALVAFALAFISSLTGVVFITKYEPMKILSERN